MSQLPVPIPSPVSIEGAVVEVDLLQASLPALARLSAEHRRRFSEFFTVPIRNVNTRRAYKRAAHDFFLFIDSLGVHRLEAIEPRHVACWVEELEGTCSAPTVKARLAGVRHLLDWLTTGHLIPFNPAHAVRGPKHSVKRGKTPYLEPAEARALLDAIAIDTLHGLRDRALIGLMVYTFARIGAALQMKVSDVYHERRRLWVRLHEKRGIEASLPAHHNLEAWLTEYMETAALAATPDAWLFQSIPRRSSELTGRPMAQADAFAMVRRRATAAGIKAKVGNHSFRATGVTAFLKNGGTLETAAAMANHASTRTTQLYDRRQDDITLDEVERIAI
jgi:integrase/recombinase XerC